MQYSILVNDIQIYFPYQPYQTQIDYMKFVIDTLNNQEISTGLMESPTGTGKTLCQLCAVLAWVNHQKIKNNDIQKKYQILYCSRTHSQLKQVVQQINKSAYRPRTLIKASQKQYLLQNQKNTIQIQNQQEVPCPVGYKSNFYIKKQEQDNNNFDIDDIIFNSDFTVSNIEEYQQNCETNQQEPYSLGKIIQNNVDLVLLSYKYLLDQEISTSSQIQVKDKIIIFDEGHSVPRECEDGKSFKISILEIKQAIEFLDFDIEYFNSQKAKKLKKIAQNFIQQINDTNIQDQDSLSDCLDPSICFQELVKQNPYKIFIISGTIQPFDKFSAQLKENKQKEFVGQVVFEQKTQLLGGIISTGYEYEGYYLMNYNNLQENGEILFYDIGLSIKRVLKYIENGVLIIFTTYKLMNQCYQIWKKQGIINKNDKIHGKEVFLEKQENQGFFCKECQNSMQKLNCKKLISKIKNISCQECQEQKSYENYYLQCKHDDQIQLICKQCVKEKGNFMDLYNEQSQIKNGENTGAILFSVFRAKNTEGIDFSDNLARAVFIVGQPYLPIKDDLIMKKVEYQNKHFNNQDWYQLEMQKEVKQAIGRIHRHKYDWGGIFLYDSRFSTDNAYFPQWLKQSIKNIQSQSILEKQVEDFYKITKPQQLLDLQSKNQQILQLLEKNYGKGFQLFQKMGGDNFQIKNILDQGQINNQPISIYKIRKFQQNQKKIILKMLIQEKKIQSIKQLPYFIEKQEFWVKKKLKIENNQLKNRQQYQYQQEKQIQQNKLNNIQIADENQKQQNFQNQQEQNVQQIKEQINDDIVEIPMFQSASKCKEFVNKKKQQKIIAKNEKKVNFYN